MGAERSSVGAGRVRRRENTGITYLVSVGDMPLFIAQNILWDMLSLVVYLWALSSREVAADYRAWENRKV